jgi:hypothetical protein
MTNAISAIEFLPVAASLASFACIFFLFRASDIRRRLKHAKQRASLLDILQRF